MLKAFRKQVFTLKFCHKKFTSMAEKNVIKEGKATITFDGDAAAFYNPAQEFNRDLTVAVLRELSKERKTKLDQDVLEQKAKRRKVEVEPGITILDALSASGLRAVRFAKEVPNVRSVLANDFSETAVDTIRNNIESNNVADIVQANYGDAVNVMQEHRIYGKRFDAVDLDPYGSPAHFLDAAIQSVRDGGILMVTCTDTAVLCGNTPETCYAKYGGFPIKGDDRAKEVALRIMLKCLDTHAARYSRCIEPLISLSVDFYVRLFVRLDTGAAKAKNACCKQSYLYQCTGCTSIFLQPLATKLVSGNSVKFSAGTAPTVDKGCEYCGSRYYIAGPMWSEPIHNREFVENLLESIINCSEEQQLNTASRLKGMLTLVLEELPSPPLFQVLQHLCRVLRCPALKLNQARSTLLNAGYKVSGSHISPMAIKTDATTDVLWDILRAWRSTCGESRELPENTPGAVILSKEPKLLKPNFTLHPECESKSKLEGLLRFQCNKGKNWGPKQKAKGSVDSVFASTMGYVKSSNGEKTETLSTD